MNGVSLPFIKVAHPSSRLGDPTTINIRGFSRDGPRTSSRSPVDRDLHQFSSTQLRPVTAGDVPFQAKKSPQNGQLSSLPENVSVRIATDRNKPILPIFGNRTDLGSRCASRPVTSSSAIGSGRITLEEIERILREKIKTAYYSIKNSFKSFDPEGRGNVSRESLHKILCNFLAMPVTLSQFNKLMMRMGFEEKRIISIEEFYAQFRPVKSTTEYPTWLDIHHRESDKMTASQVHTNLKEKVKQRLLDLGSIIPQANPDGTKRILKTEFRNSLNQLGLTMTDAEFDKLWTRYDVEKTGTISAEYLLGKLGIQMESRNGSKTGRGMESISGDRNSISLEQATEELDLNKFLSRQFRLGARDIYHAFLEVDMEKKGTVSKDQFAKVFREYDIRVSNEQIEDLLVRCGLVKTEPIDYKEFLRKYQSRSQGGMANKILANPDHSYHSKEEGDKNLSVTQIEGKLLDLFQKDYLTLLANFRKLDKANTSTVTPGQFCVVLETNLGIEISDASMDKILANVPLDENGNIRYTEYIAQFDARERQSLFDTKSVLQNPPNFRLSAGATGSHRPLTSQTEQSQALSYDSSDGRNVEELTALIKSALKKNYQAMQQEFYDLDEYNTKRLTPTMLRRLLRKFGVTLSGNEVKRIWDTFITEQGGTLEFNQFIRHFVFSLKSAAYPNAKLSPPKRGDSDFQVRSKKLNSDFHMLEDHLKSKICCQYEKLQQRFDKLDREKCGLIPSSDFKDILQDLCNHMTDYECDQICNKFDVKKDGRIAWKEFLRPFSTRHQIYRQGNNMSEILNHQDLTEAHHGERKSPGRLKGLLSVTEKLREKLSGDWRTLRRAFRKLDSNNEGYLSVDEFKSVLKLCSVFIDEEEVFQLLSELDDSLEGKIPYREFLNRAMSSMSTLTWSSGKSPLPSP